ncbi:DEAD/DEAH box helicase [Paracoccus sanguinis]|uniref:Damage-inducible protein n=1 Tax=Paracoccus sanguinis TaxID=1545044 RepID=A0A099GIN6_9RHOB|nr:type ISP restriction/modification enzyme [Paracoccus sanguinis]KGJ22541.1 damage-inducible protein [Paracoccus sanguinis]
MTALDRLLQSYRDAAVTEREKGTYFERLALAYFQNDPVQSEEYEAVWTWSEWAKANGRDGKDIGIDLVSKLRNEDGFAAIQAKFYTADTRIQKAHIDSFISASGKEPFRRRIVLDTTEHEWSANAEEMIRGQAIPVVRIGLTDLRESRIDWTIFEARGEIVLAARKTLMPHQRDALAHVRDGLAKADRGKMIMACGTGKTFTALKIAEDLAGKGKRVLFMVPSLALMSQTVREWTNDTETPIRAFAVCSDAHVGKRRKNTDDIAEIEIHDLAFPATTDPQKVAEKAGDDDPERMTVIFSTYQSIGTLSRAQEAGLPAFDLIICDEAHRTTGATLDKEDESNFVKIHSDEHVAGRKRLYMTATPRIFGDNVRSKADEVGAELASMDDPALFGETLFYRGFGWAVQNGLLTDYKVIVLAMDEGLVSAAVQKRLGDAGSELVLDDATKIIGCYKALTKVDLKADVAADPHPMRRALAFARDIRSSKLIRDEFTAVVDEYLGQDSLIDDDIPSDHLQCEIEHVDGTFNAKTRGALLDWLKADAGDNVCRILTNARCLSEGVDVPALDAIMFLHPRKSQIDVVQSVGRVMRRADSKKMGYVILPVGVPAGVPPEQALNDNERYRVVWQILNALRAHDERFDSTINKASLGQDISDQVEIVGVSADTEELRSVTAVVENLPSRTKAAGSGIGKGSGGPSDDVIEGPTQTEMTFSIDEFSRAIMAKIVKKCGTRDYWEDWSASIAEIAKNHITRLTGLLKDPDSAARRAFDDFLAELRDDLNDTISEGDAIEMLAQHIITRPVFETLFEGHKFTAENPVSRAMQRVLDVLNEANLDKESKDLEKFYASVRMRAHGITDPHAKQKLIVELYDKFFRRAFPRTTEKLGIVYTPVEIVDFIIHSVNEMLQEHFGQTLGSEGVHILDPFTGTGTFITRLLQSGLIAPEEMEHKFRHEIHANEIVLLAYYIAAINIEAVYHGLQGGDYVPFEGICLTDTFQMYESDDLISHYMPDNSERRRRQKATDIRVIVGNPPYSSGQTSANDNNANVAYPSLDGRIRDTYAAKSTATLKNSLYDSYIRAFRWASDRIGNAGVMSYVTNAGWVDGNAADGMRACLAGEFSDLYIFHLRGNQRTSGEQSRREGGKIFGSGSRAPIAISILVKNPDSTERGRIHFHDIGDYLDQKQKLAIIRDFSGIGGISRACGWTKLRPNEHNDWLNQRDDSFERFIVMGDKKSPNSDKLFAGYFNGVKTGRDAWCFNPSHSAGRDNAAAMLKFYNSEVDRYFSSDRSQDVEKFIDADPRKISWNRMARQKLARGTKLFTRDLVEMKALYRPFSPQWLHAHLDVTDLSTVIKNAFPNEKSHNLAIMIPGNGAAADFSPLLVKTAPSLQPYHNTQCFPLNLYGQADEESGGLFEDQTPRDMRRDGITDAGLKHFQDAYPGETISKEDVFYYVYGLLHSEDYRAKYADNLSKELPRIPRVKTAADFWAFSRAGRELGDLHVNYETVEPYPVTYKQGDPRTWVIKDPEAFYRVTKWAFGKKGKEKDKTTVIYNANITMTDVPLEAYDYVVNGKPALEWVMERQVVKTDKASGIVNDANRYAIETMNNPAYPLELFQRVITVSLRTMKIVRGLPKLEVM